MNSAKFYNNARTTDFSAKYNMTSTNILRKKSIGPKDILDAVKEISRDMDSDQPFFVADLADIISKFRYWKKKLPRVQPFYAVKANPDPVILRLMVWLGLKFDCASKGEIDAVFSACGKPSSIIYAHPFKSCAFLKYAASRRVDLMTFDSESELHKIHKVYPNARLILRFHIPNVVADFPLNNKFGCKIEECYRLLSVARSLNLNVVGTSFHVGSLCKEPSAYARAVLMARKIFDMAEELGFHFNILDLGGGFPGTSDSYDTFDKMCYHINKSLAEHFPNNESLEVIAEPGCFLVCSAFTLCTTVIGKKVPQDCEGDTEVEVMYYLNDGTYGSFGEGFELYGYRIEPLLNYSELSRRPLLTSKLWGCTCCSSDCIFQKCLLPELNVGDQLAFQNMGAYTIALATTFNGFQKPAVRYVYKNNNGISIMKQFDFSAAYIKELKSITKVTDFDEVDDSNIDFCRHG